MAQSPKHLLIDSRNRVSGTSSNFFIQMNPSLSHIKNVKLVGLALPLTNYIINSYNQNIYFSDGTDYTAVLTPGVYDYLTILTEIKSAMEASAYPGTITATYSDSTLKFTITGSVNFSFRFGSFQTNSAAYILGFNAVDTASAASFTSNDVAHLSVPAYLYINISGLPNSTITTNGDLCTFLIFSQSISGYVTYHWNNSHYELSLPGGTTNLQFFNVNLKSMGNIDFDLNDTDWQMLLELHYF